MPEGTQRRLAAIVATDVAGYSLLMEADELGTLAALKAQRMELIDPLIENHGGRIVKTMGDGLLLEFPSAVAAVEFALALQRGNAERNRNKVAKDPIRLRIGIHVGDIIIEGEDIFGSGVNVAARIEPLAAPDGISLSDDAYRQVRDRLEETWEDGGAQPVKNIARPIQIWHWRPEGSKESEAAQNPATALALPDKPSIAVLPFDNMSADPEQELFADGMTEDLITDLSKLSGLFVVARHSTFAFKGQVIDIQEVARRLGVRYVLEGSVRKAGARVRINVQLIDAISGGHLWAERYDGTVEEVFELQDEVGAKVVSALSVRLKGDEGKRLNRVHTHNLDAYELFVRAKATPYPPIPARIAAARALFERVIALDPSFAGGYAGQSSMLSLEGIFGSIDIDETAAQARALADKAVELDETFGWSHMALCLALLLQGQHEAALAAADQAIDRQPNDADAHAYRGLVLAFSGRPEQGVEPVEHALRLNPQFIMGPYLNLRGMILAMAQDFAGAIGSFEENRNRGGPVGPPVLSWSAMAYRMLGQAEKTETALRELSERFPDFRLETWNFLKTIRSPEKRQRFQNLMRDAGVPM
jgi:adenylate cyclase